MHVASTAYLQKYAKYAWREANLFWLRGVRTASKLRREFTAVAMLPALQ
jgi:hypothetical protein